LVVGCSAVRPPAHPPATHPGCESSSPPSPVPFRTRESNPGSHGLTVSASSLCLLLVFVCLFDFPFLSDIFSFRRIRPIDRLDFVSLIPPSAYRQRCFCIFVSKCIWKCSMACIWRQTRHGRLRLFRLFLLIWLRWRATSRPRSYDLTTERYTTTVHASALPILPEGFMSCIGIA
jgi:hypothetical protein